MPYRFGWGFAGSPTAAAQPALMDSLRMAVSVPTSLAPPSIRESQTPGGVPFETMQSRGGRSAPRAVQTGREAAVRPALLPEKTGYGNRFAGTTRTKRRPGARRSSSTRQSREASTLAELVEPAK